MLFSRLTHLLIAGFLWLVAGITLMSFGIFFIMQSISSTSSFFTSIDPISHFVKNKNEAALILLTLGLYFGYLAARLFLSKLVERETKRLTLLPTPLSLRYLFSRKIFFLFFALIATASLFWIFISDQKMGGLISLIIGSALTNGGVAYLRKAITLEVL